MNSETLEAGELAKEPWLHHEQVPLITPAGKNILVDKGMKNIILGLWARNIETVWSCQGLVNQNDPAKALASAYVQCIGSEAIDDFLEELAKLFPCPPVSIDDYSSPMRDLFSDEWGKGLNIHRDAGLRNLTPRCTFRFPPQYLTKVEDFIAL